MTHIEIHHARMALVDEMEQDYPHDLTKAALYRDRYRQLQVGCALIGHLFGRTRNDGDAKCVICTVSRLKGFDTDFREPERDPG